MLLLKVTAGGFARRLDSGGSVHCSVQAGNWNPCSGGEECVFTELNQLLRISTFKSLLRMHGIWQRWLQRRRYAKPLSHCLHFVWCHASKITINSFIEIIPAYFGHRPQFQPIFQPIYQPILDIGLNFIPIIDSWWMWELCICIIKYTCTSVL